MSDSTKKQKATAPLTPAEEEEKARELESIEVTKKDGRSAVWKYIHNVNLKDSVKKGDDPKLMTAALEKIDDPNCVICTICLADNKKLGECLIKLVNGTPSLAHRHLKTWHPHIFAMLDFNYKGNVGDADANKALEQEKAAKDTPLPPKKKRKRPKSSMLEGSKGKITLTQVQQESEGLKGIVENVGSICQNVERLHNLKETLGPGNSSDELGTMCETMIRLSKRLLKNAEVATSTKETDVVELGMNSKQASNGNAQGDFQG